MSFWIALGLLHFISTIFCLASLWQLLKYIRVYKFPPDQYELLWGFVHLRGIGAIYLLLLAGWIFYSSVLVISYW